MPNIKFKEVLQNLDTSALLANATCDFQTDGSTVTLTEKVLSVETSKLICNFVNHNFIQIGKLPKWALVHLTSYKNLLNYLLAYAASKVAQEIEISLEGADATAGQFDGLVTLATADGDVNDVTATTVNAGNVIDELGKIVDSMNTNTNIYAKEDTKIYVSETLWLLMFVL